MHFCGSSPANEATLANTGRTVEEMSSVIALLLLYVRYRLFFQVIVPLFPLNYFLAFLLYNSLLSYGALGRPYVRNDGNAADQRQTE